MIPTTWLFPVNFTPKNYTSKLNFEKNKLSIPERGLGFRLKIAKTSILGGRTEFFFLFKRKFTIVFFGVKLTGDYCDVAIISSLFRNQREKSKKPNFS